MLTTKTAGAVVYGPQSKKGEQMARDRNEKVKIKILKATVCGQKRVEAGKVIDATQKDARTLIAMKKAELISGKVSNKAEKVTESESDEFGDALI